MWESFGFVCNSMQKKKKKKDTDSDQTLYSVSSAELPQNAVKIKFGQIHLNEVFVGEILQSLGYRFTCSYMQNKTNTMLYSLTFHARYRLQWRQFAGKIEALFIGKIWKNVSRWFPVFLCTRHRAKLRKEETPPMKNILKKKLIKSLLFQKKNRPNLAILSVYILFNSVYV